MKSKEHLPQYHTERVEVLGRGTPTFLCRTLLMLGQVSIDLIAFEGWFEAVHGKVPDGTSLAEAVHNTLGKVAEDFIRRWL